MHHELVSHIYFDESIHERGGFILGAFVFGPDADARVSDALASCALKPGIDEFKSGARMAADAERARLRQTLREVLMDYRIAILIMPSAARESLGAEALKALRQFTQANALESSRPTVFFDKGIFGSASRARDIASGLGLDVCCDVVPEQDSRLVKGIQLADLTAHTCATMLLETLGLVTKTLDIARELEYDTDEPIELGFMLWLTIRYRFFHMDYILDDDGLPNPSVKAGPNGLYLSSGCPFALRRAAIRRFGEMYLGCTH